MEFISLADHKQIPGVKGIVISWSYRNSLRLDKAINSFYASRF